MNDIEFIAKEAEDVCQQHNYIHETDRMRCHKTGEICQSAVRICESRNGLESRACNEKIHLCLTRFNSTAFLRAKLARMGKDNHLRRVNIQASIVGKSGSSTLQTAFRFGSTVYEHGHVVKYFTGAEVVLPQNNTEYQVLLESKVQYPKITTRWNTSKLLEEDLNMKVSGKLSYGLKDHPHDIEFRGSLKKTDDQKKEVRASEDFRQCLEQERRNVQLSQTCLRVRRQASSVDEFRLAVQFPGKASQQPITLYLEQALKFYFFWELSKEEPTSSVVKSDRELVMNLNLSLDGGSADLQVDRSDLSQLYKDIRIPKCLNGILPLGLRKHFASHLFQKLTHDQAISSCRIENGSIQTFDQKSFRYELNDCNHLLFRDCSGKVPVAVLAKTEPVAKSSKIIEIMSGDSHLTIKTKNPKVSGDLVIESKVATKHSKVIELKNSSSTHFEFCTETKDALFDIRRYSDNVYSFWFHKELLQVSDYLNRELTVDETLYRPPG